MQCHGGARTIGAVDLTIREDDGWVEVEELGDAMADAPPGWGLSDLWRAVGRGDYAKAQLLLEDLGFDFDGDVSAITMIAEPDDILDDHYRVWVRYG